MARKKGIPGLSRHKATGRGIARIGGVDRYFGKWPEGLREAPPEVKREYDTAISEWLAAGRPEGLPGKKAPEKGGTPARTVEEVMAAFWVRHVLPHFVGLDGKATLERDNFAYSLRPLRHLYGRTPAAEFSPLKLKAVRELMAKGYVHPEYGEHRPLARKTVNQRVGRIKAMFGWAVSEELVPPSVWEALRSVEGLKAGRSAARETPAVGPAAPADVEKTIPHLGPHASGLVRFLLHTGARCGEGARLTLAEVDRSGDVWLYRPSHHKTAWRDKPRVVAVGPRAQDVLREFIRIRCPECGAEGRPPLLGSRDGCLCGPCLDRMDEAAICGPWRRVECHPADAPLFSPKEQRAEIHAAMRARRRSKVPPSQVCRKKKSPLKKPLTFFTASRVCADIAKACEAAGMPPWHAHQLRHLHGARARAAAGLDGAQAALGHATPLMTEHYSKLQAEKAAEVARRIG